MIHFRVAASAAVLLSFSAMAARMKIEVHDQHIDPGETVAAVTVCEDDAIWDTIMASPDVSSIRVIPWKEITDSMDNYLSNEGVLVGNLVREIEKLEVEIQEKKSAKVSQVFSDEQIQQFITDSVEATGSFGSVDGAKTSACGKPGKKPRVPFDAMDVAVEKIASLVQPPLSTGEWKSEKKTFDGVCKQFLDAGDDELANYCGEVCFELADTVQGVSDKYSKSQGDTAKLEKVLAKKKRQLLDAMSRKEQCERSKQNIDGFQKYLESLDEEIIARHTAVRKAERDLDDAQWSLEELEKALAKQRGLVSDAEKLLTGSEETVREARAEFQAVTEDADKFIEQIGAAKNQLSEMREKLANMKNAVDTGLEIKKYVSTTALKMGYYVDVAVRQPVRAIGLVEETNVWDYFSEDVTTEQCSATFKHQLSDFHQYCTGPAMEAFEKIKNFVDLTPLCKLDEETKISGEGDTGVQTRIGLLTQDLAGVQSWLDPFKGTSMTMEKEQEKIELGEPEGLRQLMGVYGDIKFYQRYMKEWKMGRGLFHELLKQLVEKTKVLEGDVLTEEALLQKLKDALEVIVKKQEGAKAKLNTALADEEAAIEGKEELEKIMASLEAYVANARSLFTDLEAVLAKAIQMFQRAKATLVSEHAAGKDGILAMSEMHMSVLDN